jgi:hypothetical protein
MGGERVDKQDRKKTREKYMKKNINSR